ncbi:MAG: hypothetical protein WAQ33_02250 [Gaiellaceae bacterium]
MTRKLAVGVLLLAVLAAGSVAAGWGSSTSKATQPRTLRYDGFDSARTIFHRGQVVADREPARGDSMMLKSLVYKPGSKRPVAHGEFFITLTSADGGAGMGTLYFPEGKLVSGGMEHFRSVDTQPILGGTGVYANVRGEIAFTHLSERKFRIVIHLAP